MLKNIKETEMKNISVFIEGKEKKTTFKFKKPIATYGTRLAAKEVTVFWNFKNVTSANNTFVITKASGDEPETLNEGYYDFQELKNQLEHYKLEIEMNVYANTCSIDNKNAEKVDLKKLGMLLGFKENHVLAANKSELSPEPVDVNFGLRWLTVTCDLIDPSKNIDLNGDESDILAFLPITPGTSLNSNCYVYEREWGWRAAKNAVVSEMEFTVTPNVTDLKVDVNILLDIALE